MIGRTVGTYKILEKIGEGGMGAVYKGVDLMLERTVAVKVLRPELGQQPKVVERFRSEAVTLAKLNHPNIATLYSFLQEEDDFFMILEFVQGRTLEDILKHDGAIPCEQAIPVFNQALAGIAHAHSFGIIHRDIKPANVMLTDNGGVKVMDFGIARVLGTARMTRTGHLIGTIEYMSPEQVQGKETDARSDIYSLGVLLYEMLTGHVPFEADSDFELMQAHVKKTPRSLRSLQPSVPANVEKVVLQALSKKPASRFQDADAFQAALEAARPAVPPIDAGQTAPGGVLARLRRVLAPAADAAPAPPKATRVAGEAEAPTAAPPTKATRVAGGVKETRMATDDEAAGPARRSAAAMLPFVWAAVPVLLVVAVLLVVKLRGDAGDDPRGTAADTTAVVQTDTTTISPPVAHSGVPDINEQIPVVPREQPILLTPEEFARQNPGDPNQPQEETPSAPADPEEQKPSTPQQRERPRQTTQNREPETPRLGSLRIIVRPFGDIYVDGDRKASSTNQAYTEDVSPGTYRVRVVHPSFGTWEKEISVQAGAERDVLFNFNVEYKVTVTSEPTNAEILVDGEPTGRYTPSVVPLRPGQHTITVRKRRYRVTEAPRRILMESDVETPLHFILESDN